MIGTWFVEGVAIGFKAFFAVLSFALCGAIVTSLFSLVVRLVARLLGLPLGGGSNDDLGGD